MKTVAKITQLKAEAIQGTIYKNSKYFKPKIDANGNYYVSMQEAPYVGAYEEIEYNPIITEI
ncbi:hypothetical protein [Seonamhaeicola sp.]|uniref:hypothetical protein n=1 Tax=Seonamhaeicola sp. TaxID=1912245 RepID=UPI00356958CF